MTEQTTIVLELTPREASVIWEMVHTYAWERGSYGNDVKNIAGALDKVRSYLDGSVTTVSMFGSVPCGEIWLED